MTQSESSPHPNFLHYGFLPNKLWTSNSTLHEPLIQQFAFTCVLQISSHIKVSKKLPWVITMTDARWWWELWTERDSPACGRTPPSTMSSSWWKGRRRALRSRGRRRRRSRVRNLAVTNGCTNLIEAIALLLLGFLSILLKIFELWLVSKTCGSCSKMMSRRKRYVSRSSTGSNMTMSQDLPTLRRLWAIFKFLVCLRTLLRKPSSRSWRQMKW